MTPYNKSTPAPRNVWLDLTLEFVSPQGKKLGDYQRRDSISIPGDTPTEGEASVDYRVVVDGRPHNVRAPIPLNAPDGSVLRSTATVVRQPKEVEETQIVRDADGNMIALRKGSLPTEIQVSTPEEWQRKLAAYEEQVRKRTDAELGTLLSRQAVLALSAAVDLFNSREGEGVLQIATPPGVEGEFELAWAREGNEIVVADTRENARAQARQLAQAQADKEAKSAAPTAARKRTP